MKKSVAAAAVAAAVVVGTSATTFAAANPFSDVPRGHWAYQAVVSLAEDGIVEGYGDGTFRGQREITRYEMAQMIAKALARTDRLFDESARRNEVDATSSSYTGGVNQGGAIHSRVRRNYHAVKADLDRLAAEFRDELDALGIRVDELEKRLDHVKWEGKIEYTYKSHRTENYDRSGKTRVNQDDWIFRFEPTCEVNDHWTLHARIDAHTDLSRNASTSFDLVRGWAQGDYKNFQVKVGKQPLYTNEDGIVWDTEYSGAEITFGNLIDGLRATVYGGRLSAGTVTGTRRHAGAWDGRQDGGSGEARFFEAAGAEGNLYGTDPSSFWGANIQYQPKEHGLFVGAGYYDIKDDDLRTTAYTTHGSSNRAKIWSANLGYKFNDKAQLWGSYAENTKADHEKTSWQALFKYGTLYGGGNQNTKRGEWAVWAGYKKLGSNASFCAINWDDAFAGTRGVVAGASYAPMDRVVFLAKYFKGKYITGDGKAERLFGRVEFFF